MSEIKHSFVCRTNGMDLHVAQIGEGFPVVFCHGFPELWYSWRHQMKALAEAGFRAIAPDQRGYGETECAGADRGVHAAPTGRRHRRDARRAGYRQMRDRRSRLGRHGRMEHCADGARRRRARNRHQHAVHPARANQADRRRCVRCRRAASTTFSIFKRRALRRRNSNATSPARCAASTRIRRK